MKQKSVYIHPKGDAEITDLKNVIDYSGLKNYTDADLARDIATRRSVTCVVHEYNKEVFS